MDEKWGNAEPFVFALLVHYMLWNWLVSVVRKLGFKHIWDLMLIVFGWFEDIRVRAGSMTSSQQYNFFKIRLLSEVCAY